MKKDTNRSLHASLADMLMTQAERYADKLAFVSLSYEKGETPEETGITYGMLHEKAMGVARMLYSHGATKKQALLLYPPGIDYIVSFFGSLYARVIPVPAYPPLTEKFLSRLIAIIKDAKAEYALSIAPMAEALRKHLDQNGFSSLKLVITDPPEASYQAIHSGMGTGEEASTETIAFLQYTSGSTAAPKGVVLTHGNLLDNLQATSTPFMASNEPLRAVMWLPPYHDMGLIGFILQTVYTGQTTYFMSPVDFLWRPMRWLEAIHLYRPVVSGGPNFAYDLCVKKAAGIDVSRLDLSSWKYAINGAEPVRHETIERFSKTFAPAGFKKEAFIPGYGLAEATLMVSGDMDRSNTSLKNNHPPLIRRFNRSALEQGRVVPETSEKMACACVGCGRPLQNQEVVIVNTETLSRCEKDQVGEIWVKGESIGKGYWNNPKATEQIFHAYLKDTGEGPYLRTGDLGFISEEELFITGRIKDLLIVRGRNIYPQDIEHTVEGTHEAFRKGCSAAFSLTTQEGEQIVLVQEIKQPFIDSSKENLPRALSHAAASARKSVSTLHGVELYALAFIRQNEIPKTSSGKIQRSACRKLYLENRLNPILLWVRQGEETGFQEKDMVSTGLNESGEPGSSFDSLKQIWADVLEMDLTLVSRASNFFECSGSSLKGVELLSRIQKRWNVTLSLKQLFDGQTLGSLLNAIENAGQTVCPKIKKTKKKQLLSLSPSQMRLYALSTYDPSSILYNIPLAFQVEGSLELETIKASIQKIITRHESLRTSFHRVNGNVLQRVSDRLSFSMELRNISDDQMENAIESFIRPFDLSTPPLVRASILKSGPTKAILLVDIHHIITDGLSLRLLFQEFMAILDGKTLPAPLFHYRDYLSWQEKRQAAIQRQKGFFLSQFKGELPFDTLPIDFPRQPIQKFTGSSIDFNAGEGNEKGFLVLLREAEATPCMGFFAVFSIMLSKIAATEDLILGTVMAGRGHPDLSPVTGLFVNTVPLRVFPKKNKTFTEYLRDIRHLLLNAHDNQEYPFDALIEALNLKRESHRNPLFNVMFSYQDFFRYEEKSGGLTFRFRDIRSRVSRFDLTLILSEREGSWQGTFEYSTDLFKETTIRRFAGYMNEIIREVTTNPQRRIQEIGMIPETEKKRIMIQFRGEERRFPLSKTVSHAFNAIAKTYPQKVAIVDGERSITYQALNDAAGTIASLLRKNMIPPGTTIGVTGNRTLETFTAILGIVKASLAYLAIDPSYPPDRIDHMLKESGARILLTPHGLPEHLKRLSFDGSIIDLSKEMTAPCPALQAIGLIEVVESSEPDQPLYAVFTSGSTGVPKGMRLNHKGCLNLVSCYRDYFNLTPDSKTTQVSSLGFDALAFEIWPALLSGATLYIVQDEIRMDPERLKCWLIENQVTISFQPTLVAEKLISSTWPRGVALSTLLAAGERLNRFPEKNIPFLLYNCYGPSEDTVWTTVALVKEDPMDGTCPPIGRPIFNHAVYILDPDRKIVPIGVYGELAISGVGIAPGYLNQPEKTSAKFIPNPFGKKGERLYLTGDLARWLENGEIEFAGRVDTQVQLRGFRIETGEVESVLKKLPNIGEAVVLKKTDRSGDDLLWAFFVSTEEKRLSEIKSTLSKKLPGFMIPSRFTRLEAMPLLPNGKVDRKSLSLDSWPFLEEDQPPDTIDHFIRLCPTNALLRDIWADLLSVDKRKIGPETDFFDAGGHSFKAVKMAGAIHQKLNIKIPLSKIFEHSRFFDFAEYIAQEERSICPHIGLAKKKNDYAVTPDQKRIYILDKLEGAGIAWNAPMAFFVEGGIDLSKVEETIKALVRRHEALRTSFSMKNGAIVQKIHEEIDLPIEFMTADEKEIPEKMKTFIRPFNLGVPPLIRALTVKLSNRKHLIAVDMHHIITDGVSAWILFKEFFALYQGERLDIKTLQPKDYAEFMADRYREGGFSDQEKYWRERFQGELTPLSLPLDFERPSIKRFRGKKIAVPIDQAIRAKAGQLLDQTRTTWFMFLAAVFSILLSRYSGKEDIVIGTTSAGRNHPDTDNLVGYFLKTLSLRTFPEKDLSFLDFLNQVKETALSSFSNQDFSYASLIEKLPIKKDLSRNPLFDCMLIVQNMDMPPPDTRSLSVTPYTPDFAIAKMDLTIEALFQSEGIQLVFEYCTDLFKEESIRRMISRYLTLMAQILRDPSMPLSALSLMSEKDKNELVCWECGPALLKDKEKTLVDLLNEQAEKTPEKIALLFEAETGLRKKISYWELNDMARHVAGTLLEKGALPGEIVAITGPPAICRIVGMIGILMAGCAYMPIDGRYPERRLRLMLENTQSRFLVMAEEPCQDSRLPDSIRDAVISISLPILEKEKSGMAPLPSISANSWAAIIHTSGSTGTPKGVILSHENLVNYVAAFRHRIGIGQNDIVLQQAAFTFDGFIEEVFPTLASGGAIAIPERATAINPNLLSSFIQKHGVTLVSGSPLLLRELNRISEKERLNSVHTFVSGGDVLQWSHINTLVSKARVFNSYGPTETSVAASYYECSPTNEGSVDETLFPQGRSIPIGKPLASYQIRIVDESFRPVPPGMAGEIIVLGPGVTSGYLNDLEETKQKFISIPDMADTPHGLSIHSLLFRTGDMGRWLSSGNIEFLGRKDDQVKIRGYRIEPLEIVNALGRHPEIEEAVVLPKIEGDTPSLVAYLVSKRPFSTTELREFLSEHLPDYMMPSKFVKIDTIPLTSHGKIDKRSLLERTDFLTAKKISSPPSTPLEHELLEIWKEVLKTRSIGVEDSFFDAGGDSIKAMMTASAIHQRFQIHVNLVDFFKNPTIRSLARMIGHAEKSAFSEIERTPEKPFYPLSFNQKRLWVIHQMEPGSSAYAISGSLTLNEAVDPDIVKQVLHILMMRHESMRTGFRLGEGNDPVQFIDVERPVHLDIIDLSSFQEPTRRMKKKAILAAQQERPFQLEKPPLFRASLLKIGENEWEFSFTMHHIVTDGWSIDILRRDAILLYEACKNNRPDPLQPLPISYVDFVSWQNIACIDSLKGKRSSSYWKKILEQGVPRLSLPCHPAGDNPKSAGYRIAVTGPLFIALDQIRKERHTSLFILLYGILIVLLARITGETEIFSGIPASGRDHVSLQEIVGFFINTIILRNRVVPAERFSDFLSRLDGEVMEALEHQGFPLELVCRELAIPFPEIQVFFNMFNMQDVSTGMDLEEGAYHLETVREVKFDMVFYVTEYQNGIDIQCHYRKGLFTKNTIESLMTAYEKLMGLITQDIEKPIESYKEAPGRRSLVRKGRP